MLIVRKLRWSSSGDFVPISVHVTNGNKKAQIYERNKYHQRKRVVDVITF